MKAKLISAHTDKRNNDGEKLRNGNPNFLRKKKEKGREPIKHENAIKKGARTTKGKGKRG